MMRFLRYFLSFEWIYGYEQRKRPNGHTRYFG
jgi:hypothetical protein